MQSADPEQTFSELTDAEKHTFVEAMTPTTVTTTELTTDQAMPMRASNGCWNQQIQQDYRSNFGFVTYRLFVSSHWCAENDRITSHSITGASGQKVAPGYTFEGISAQGATNYGDRGVSVAQGHFKVWDAPEWIPGTHHYPCARQTTFPGRSEASGHIGGSCMP